MKGKDRKIGVLKCLEWATGKVTWSKRGLGKGSLAVAGGWLVVLSERGELVVARADPKRFEPIARAKVLTGTCWTPPTIARGRLYCRSYEGQLVCLEVAPGRERPVRANPRRVKRPGPDTTRAESLGPGGRAARTHAERKSG